MTQPPDWVTNTPAAPVHTEPASTIPGTTPFPSINLLQFVAKFVEHFLEFVVKGIVGIFIPGGGSALDQLSHWATTLLPAAIREPLGQLVEILIDALNLVPIFGPLVGDAVEYLANVFGLLDDKTGEAQQSANTANASIAELRASLDAGTSGAKIIDTFDRAADATANGLGANWVQDYSSGAGTLGVGGSGSAHWTVNGSSNRTCHARHVTPLTSDVQVARLVLDAAIPAGNSPTILSLCLRMDSTKTTWVEARIGQTSCEIGYVTGATNGFGGTYTRFGSATTITSAAGNIFEFRAGRADGTEDYELILMQDNATRCTQTDSSHVSNKGLSYLYTGMIVTAGWAFSVFFGAPLQSQPPDIQVFTATDNTP